MRGKGVDGAGSVEGLAKPRENQDWSKLNGQPSAYHPSGDSDIWAGFADAENKSTGNMHTATDRVCWS